MIDIPSPAVAVVGRHNSGKTTLVVKLIQELAARGLDVGSVKHHTHGDFDIDYPGKDSYRHREAGATQTVIASPNKMAQIKTLTSEVECSEIVRSMPNHDIVIVEGYRKSGLPTIEVMRQANNADAEVAKAFYEGAKSGASLGFDFTQAARSGAGGGTRGEVASGIDSANPDLREKMPVESSVAVVTDIEQARQAAAIYNIPSFDLDDVSGICDFLQAHFTRPPISVVIQAGGESKRMGESKALVEFCGRPLICRIIERLGGVADELVITTNERERLAPIIEKCANAENKFADIYRNIRLVPDKYKTRGALPGLYTALNAATHDMVAVVACDMVFASAALVLAEISEMAKSEADVVVPVNKHGYEPFHAAFRKSTCVPAIDRAIEADQSRVQCVFDDDDIMVVEFPHSRVLEVEPMGGCFINTNTPDELRRIESNLLDK